MTKRLIAVGFGLALLLGCGRDAPADYFPLKAGQQRAMKVLTRMIAGKDTTETTEVRVVEIVRGLEDVPGMGKCWVVESPRDSGRASYSFFRKNDDGIIQLTQTSAGKPPVEMLYLALPLVKGLKWYDTKAESEMMEVTAQETVKVQAGTYPDCYVVAVKSTRGDWSMTQWLAPNVGAVKWENRAGWTDKEGTKHEMLKLAELVAFRVPRDSGK
ncbi:MAG: hypothetical protein NTX53_15460 [candidate division WOR-3 bacterium]|nr:hypothetical protein [candidate division WOR-3 bacterium]